MDQRQHVEQDTVEFVDPTLQASDPAAGAGAGHEMTMYQGVPPAPEQPPERFPVVWRGYDRASVDALLAELEAELDQLRIQHEPQAAVSQEIDRIGAATADIIRVAHERAERITSRSREESNARLDLAHAEAKQITAQAEKRRDQLDADAETIWQERRRLIDDTRQLADQLLAVADDAAERFPEEEPGVEAAVNGTAPEQQRTMPAGPVRAPKPEAG